MRFDLTDRLPIAFAMSRLEPGGTERQMLELVRRLDPSRWQVHVTCFRTDGGWFGRVPPTAVVTPFPVTSFRRASLARQMWAFAQWCRSRRIAIVHATDLPSNIFALPAAALARVPVRIGNRREVVANRSAWEIALQRAAYASAHKVVANSAAAANRLEAERVPAGKIAVIPNGLDVHPFPVRRPGVAPRRVVIVANLRREKRHDVLIDAAPAVLERYPDARFEIVGDGPERERLEERARIRGVAGAFAFAGHQEDVASRLASADLFVMTSESEAFPNALLEAMAAGLPAIASAVGGILEVVDEGRTGLLAPVGDPAAVAERICRVMADAGLANALGSAARREVEARYSFDRMTTAFESVYVGELMRRGVLNDARPQLAAS